MTDSHKRTTLAYDKLFKALSNKDLYEVRTVYEHYITKSASPSPSKITVVLRIDVDFACHLTLPLAKILRDNHLAASFFYLPNKSHYSLFRGNLVYNVLDLGHEVGLHSDHLYQSIINRTNAVEDIRSDVRLFKAMGIPIKGLVCHGHLEIEKLGMLNWDLVKDIYPHDLGLEYTDGLHGNYITPGIDYWKPSCDVQISDYLGFPNSYGWNYVPDWPTRLISKARRGQVVHIGMHNHSCFRYWLDWDPKYNERPLNRDSPLEYLYKKAAININYRLKPTIKKLLLRPYKSIFT